MTEVVSGYNLRDMTSLLELRKLSAKSRAQVARDIGISERALYSLENELSPPRRLTALALASYYGVAVDEITNGDKPTPLEEGT